MKLNVTSCGQEHLPRRESVTRKVRRLMGIRKSLQTSQTCVSCCRTTLLVKCNIYTPNKANQMRYGLYARFRQLVRWYATSMHMHLMKEATRHQSRWSNRRLPARLVIAWGCSWTHYRLMSFNAADTHHQSQQSAPSSAGIS